MNLSILYRGPLSSCNYACGYCPFAKRRETATELTRDREALARFVDWVGGRAGDRISILFTPWGEALVRAWYRDALVRLSHLPNVPKVAIQTNLSCGLTWVDRCNRESLALWTTYHPSQVDRKRFLRRCRELDRRAVRYSVGVVGLREHFDEIRALRAELDAGVYLWVNAYKRVEQYYSADELRELQAIDPLFPLNAVDHASRGRRCQAGSSVISVDGDGVIRRCHFIREPIGNIFDEGFEQALAERPCTNETCGCHIGYVHLDDLNLYDVFGDGVLERIPAAYGGGR